MCDAMQNCSDHGVCQDNGQCKCNAGWLGHDCSNEALDFSNSTIVNVTGNKWVFGHFTWESSEWALVIQFQEGTAPVTVYIKYGLNNTPSQFDFDVKLGPSSHSLYLTRAIMAADSFTVAI